ncbi:MAG TPA: ABC-F family ATP-binding cassette domain-containing protein [Acidobacteriaceae bacterium]|jgi:ATP-binding cassette subfamily F protein 3|nr:ABC-F family ATP-binding cassette domain-containing protein [Acidobacteriaceae bacterium]
MLQLIDAGKRFGTKLLFENVSWQLTSAERTGLVGGNGTGKSTLLRILAGMDGLDYGRLEQTSGMTIGYLPQDGLQMHGQTVFDECLSVFAATRALQAQLESLSEQMSILAPDGPEYAAAANRFAQMQTQLHVQDGYTQEAQVGAVLMGLGFRKEDWPRRTEEFSGGWQMRIALAKLLLQKPTLLLLDEPTNHLDIESRNWLEEYLQQYPHAFVVISHDRYFLDVTVRKTVEIWNRRLHVYSGNYEKYLQQKAERRAQLEASYRNQRDQIEHLEAFISRFRAQATKAKQVQSRIKELERIERIELPQEESVIHFEFPQPPPSGRMVAEVENLDKSYGALNVFSGIHFTIERGDRIALVGPNGAGKSTLIGLLAGNNVPTGGAIRLGHNVTMSYFAQDQYKALDPELRMLDDLGAVAPRIPVVQLRSLLGCFLFSGEDVFKPLGVLSGGERNRYAVARLLVSPANFLLLDEPTNHLDLRAKDVLLEALRNFSGTIVFVSHDRLFIDQLATRVFEVKDQSLRVYSGNYEDYLRQQAKQVTPVTVAQGKPATDTPNKDERKSFAAAPATAAENNSALQPVKRLNPIKLRQIQERCAELEEEIPRLEAAMQTAEQAMGVFISAAQTQTLIAQMDQLRKDHAAALTEWESFMVQLEEQSTLS